MNEFHSEFGRALQCRVASGKVEVFPINEELVVYVETHGERVFVIVEYKVDEAKRYKEFSY